MEHMVSLLQILLLAQHVSGTIMPIIRSSRVLYRWLLPVVFGALLFKLPVWCNICNKETICCIQLAFYFHNLHYVKPSHIALDPVTNCCTLLY